MLVGVASPDTLSALQTRRGTYAAEMAWHRLLIDAFTGGGGFSGSVERPVDGFLATAADAYSAATIARSTTYLDRYSSREDDAKLAGRRAVAHYKNYVRPTTELKVSYLLRKGWARTGIPERVREWMERTQYDVGVRRRALMACILGWCPVVVDMPRKPDGIVSVAQMQSTVGTDPYLSSLLPLNAVDWQTDENGRIVWARTCVTSEQRGPMDLASSVVRVDRHTVWTSTDWTVFVVHNGTSIVSSETGKHSFGQVPIVSWRASANVDCPFRGDSVIGDLATEAKRLFNLESEFDEMMRASCFPMLAAPGRPPARDTSATDAEYADAAAIETGPSNVAYFDPQFSAVPFYLEPSGQTAAVYAKRIEATVQEMYRIARVEYDRPSGTASSAQSKQQNFEQTNLAIADIAAGLALADLETLKLVAKALGVGDAEIAGMGCAPHDSYASEDLGSEIDQVFKTLESTEMGETYRVEALKRLVPLMLPGLDAKTRAVIDSEIGEAVAAKTQESAAMLDAHAHDAAAQADAAMNQRDARQNAQNDGAAAQDPQAKA